MAQGKYLVIQDDDDIMPPDRLKKQVAYMENNPQIGISVGLIRFMDLNGRFYANQGYLPTTEFEIKFMDTF